MRMKVGILTDDLSGGMNIGVEFSAAGMETLLVQAGVVRDAEVLIVNTETRNRAPDVAYQTVREAARTLRQMAPEIVVKKIDSLLRGAIGQEVTAVREVFGFERCLLVAASPKIGRKTVGGYHHVDSYLLEMVLPQVDPSSPIEGSNILTIVGKQTDLPIELIGLDTIYEGAAAIRTRIQQSKAGVLVADCAEQADLNRVVEAAYRAGIRFFAGTYGMGEALSRLYEQPGRPTLFLIGTLSAVAHQQVQALKDAFACAHIQVAYDETFLDRSAADYALPYRAALTDALAMYPHVILQVSTLPDQAEQLWYEAMLRGIDRAEIAARIDALVRAVLTPMPVGLGGFVATGGTTAFSLFGLLGADGLRLETREILPGTPGARIVGGPHDGLPFIAKPGSQGADDALVRLARYVQEINHAHRL
ncbi:MAG: hypothetical protein K8J31_28535 [Anaerolineae bacterium]|nr:hypothetical protein [Anaerolineae bacterium]